MSENSFLELCDKLRDKYSMTEGDWKTLLEQGRDLYARLPDGVPTRDEANVVANDNAIRTLDLVQRDLDPVLGQLTKSLVDVDEAAANVEVGLEAEEPYSPETHNYLMSRALKGAHQIVLQRIDALLENVGMRCNLGPDTRRIAEAATARMAARRREWEETGGQAIW